MSEVTKEEVARYYINCELDNIVQGDAICLREGLYNTNLPRLLEALSFTYRANSVFDYVENGQFRWTKREVAIDDVTLTGMDEELTNIIYSSDVQQSPRKFVKYIHDHPNDGRLLQLTPKYIPENRKIILLRQDGNKLKMLDGSHRFITMVINGNKRVVAYIAIPKSANARPMIGDATFLRLRRIWEQTNDTALRESIEKTVTGMIAHTKNGYTSVQSYWVRMAPNQQVRNAGKKILDESSSGKAA